MDVAGIVLLAAVLVITVAALILARRMLIGPYRKSLRMKRYKQEAGERYFQWLEMNPTELERAEYTGRLIDAAQRGLITEEDLSQRAAMVRAATKNADMVAAFKGLEPTYRRE